MGMVKVASRLATPFSSYCSQNNDLLAQVWAASNLWDSATEMAKRRFMVGQTKSFTRESLPRLMWLQQKEMLNTVHAHES